MFIVNVITLVILGLAEKFYLLLISIHLYPLSLSLSQLLSILYLFHSLILTCFLNRGIYFLFGSNLTNLLTSHIDLAILPYTEYIHVSNVI